MIKQVLAVVAVVGLALAPATSWAKDGSGPGSSAGGGNNGNGGGASHGGGQGGGDGGHGGGNGGHGGGDGGNGGNGGGNHGGGDGGHSGGGATGGGGTAAGGGVSAGTTGPDGATGTLVNDGGSGYGDRDHLVTVLRACTWDRLATYDTTYLSGWSVRTFDDVQWPIIYRCMKAHGYTPNGPDYTQQTNFGSR